MLCALVQLFTIREHNLSYCEEDARSVYRTQKYVYCVFISMLYSCKHNVVQACDFFTTFTFRKEFFLMLSGPVQRSVRRVWVQECETNGL